MITIPKLARSYVNHVMHPQLIITHFSVIIKLISFLLHPFHLCTVCFSVTVTLVGGLADVIIIVLANICNARFVLNIVLSALHVLILLIPATSQ